MTVAYWPGARWHGPKPVADNEKPLDDRLGAGGPRWKIDVAYVDSDGVVTSDRTEVQVKEYERSLRVATTPDIVVEMNAGMLARNILRQRKNKRA